MLDQNGFQIVFRETFRLPVLLEIILLSPVQEEAYRLWIFCRLVNCSSWTLHLWIRHIDDCHVAKAFSCSNVSVICGELKLLDLYIIAQAYHMDATSVQNPISSYCIDQRCTILGQGPQCINFSALEGRRKNYDQNFRMWTIKNGKQNLFN